MKKRMLLLGMAIWMAAALAGCGNDTTASTDQNTAADQEMCIRDSVMGDLRAERPCIPGNDRFHHFHGTDPGTQRWSAGSICAEPVSYTHLKMAA